MPDKRPILVMLVSATLLLVANMSVEPIITSMSARSRGRGRTWCSSPARDVGRGLCRHDRRPGIGRFADRHGHWRVIVASFVAAGRPARSAGVRHGPWQLVILRFLMGLALAGLMPAITALIRRNAPDAAIGRILGFSQSAQYLGRSPAPFAGARRGSLRHARGVSSPPRWRCWPAPPANEAMRRGSKGPLRQENSVRLYTAMRVRDSRRRMWRSFV